jgi:hypothetical protein
MGVQGFDFHAGPLERVRRGWGRDFSEPVTAAGPGPGPA